MKEKDISMRFNLLYSIMHSFKIQVNNIAHLN